MYALTAAVLVAFLVYLASSTFTWIGAMVLGVSNITWERCAVLGGFHIGAVIVLLGIIRLWTVLHTFTTGVALMGSMVGFAWFIVWITVHVLDISFWKAAGIVLVVVMLDQAVALGVQRTVPLFLKLMGL